MLLAFLQGFRDVIETAETDHFKGMFRIFLCEFEAINETALAHK
jgi:hypothetical protein